MTTPAGWHPDPEGSGQLRWWDGQQWTSAVQPYPASPTQPEPMPELHAAPESGKTNRKKWPWIAGAAAALVVIAGAFGSLDKSSDEASSAQAETTQPSATQTTPTTTKPTTSTTASSTTTATTTTVAPTRTQTQAAPVETVTQTATVTVESATRAPASTQAGLTAGQRNAVRSASDYLDYTAFSRQGLIEQLEFEDYSTEDATFAVDYISPDWNEQAAKSAEIYLDYSAFSRQGLIDQLMFEGYTRAQAEYGVDQAGL